MSHKRVVEICEAGHMDRLREWVASTEADLDQIGEGGETVLHVLSRRGYLQCVRVLIAAGANLDVQDVNGQTALHESLMGCHSQVALLLINSGANTDLQNTRGDAAIHVAVRNGMTSICRALCAVGCSLDIPNGAGLYPLHLAARYGHLDVVRCLCLSGCNVEQRNSDGIKAEITAFKNGYYPIGELLNKLRIRSNCDGYIKQLMPTDRVLSKINVKFIGEQGSGKTTLIRSLKAGYFVGLFARTKSQQSTGSNKSCPASPTNTHIEMDVAPHGHRTTDQAQYQYTRGIEIHQASFSCGDVTMWDVSGLSTYHQIYDLFIGEPTSIYVLTFNLRESLSTQHYHCSFWLNFLTARVKPQQSLSNVDVRVILVGTHADTARVPRDSQGAFVSRIAQELRDRLVSEVTGVTIDPRVILVNGHAANSQGLRDLKNTISTAKEAMLQGVLNSTGFLENALEHLPNWRKELEAFPVLTVDDMIARVHKFVNPLAGEEHVLQLLAQLAIMGEAMLLKSQPDDLIVIDLPWLCGADVIGGLLSLESIARARLTGCYTEDDFQGAFPLAPAQCILPLLTALQLCTQCENDDETEYEFPCLNMVERLDGLWEAKDERYSLPNSCYAGARIKAPYKLLQTIFPRLQVQLRRTAIMCEDPDGDLYQWFRGSKLCAGDIEAIITLEQDGQVIDVKIRGTNALRLACFYFMAEIMTVLEQVLGEIVPGAIFERHILSSEELRLHSQAPHCWRPEHVLAAILTPDGLKTSLHNPNLNREESLLDLVGFGAEAVTEVITLGGDLPISELNPACQMILAKILDPPDPLGRDWCLLAVKLGLAHKIALIDNEHNCSKTAALLDLWAKQKDSNIGNLIKRLIDLGREDAAEAVLASSPLLRVKTTSPYGLTSE